jgi:thiamine-phosphate pyrophosphorylase
VTDDAVLARGGWESRAADVLASGGARLCLHLRGPRTDGATLHRLALGLLPRARRVGARLFVNDRVDVALVLEVDGVHLGGRSLPVSAARALLGPGRWLGVSCRDAAQISASRHEGADYAFLGSIFQTPTHPEAAGMGLEGLAATLGGLGGFPVVGIGGIDPASVAGVLGAGAYGVAVVRGVWNARDPATAVRRYVEAIETGVTERGGSGL